MAPSDSTSTRTGTSTSTSTHDDTGTGTVAVRDDREASRYEAVLDGRRAGVAEYQKAGRLVVFTHTEVDPSFEGRGVASALIGQALDDVRRQGLPVLPLCPFVKAFIGRHPQYADLVYAAPASRATD